MLASWGIITLARTAFDSETFLFDLGKFSTSRLGQFLGFFSIRPGAFIPSGVGGGT
jgi:hypothetical protein